MGKYAESLNGIAESGAVATVGGLLGSFVILAVECQRHWPGTSSLIYFATSGVLLLVWCAYLATWPMAVHHARSVISGAIIALLVASLLFRMSTNPGVADELVMTLIFWTPLVAGWWAWDYAHQPVRLVGLLSLFFAATVWQTAKTIPAVPEHLLLSILIAALVRYAHLSNRPSESTITLRDSLTGLASAECFEAELAHASAISDRYQMPLALIGYKVSPQGLDAGYEADLRRHADAIVNCLRQADTACRWDETTLAVLLPNTDEKQASTVLAKIDDAVRQIATARSRPSLLASRASVVHQAGEDPMSTLATLEAKLAERMQ